MISLTTGTNVPRRALSEAEAADRLLHGSSFGAAAAAYAAHRPGYAEDAVAFTSAPTSYRQFAHQRRRWARGLIEAFDLSDDPLRGGAAKDGAPP